MNTNDRAGPQRHAAPGQYAPSTPAKSTEEGLEQEFNSLDAQREAAEAYVRSQAGLASAAAPTLRRWRLHWRQHGPPRPATPQSRHPGRQNRLRGRLQGRDRLSRSLLDFARLMETFEQHQVAFVSVTQLVQHTASSMGRLVLNVLLSFAQFEREIIAERTRRQDRRHKARKGKWAGGRPLLGFDVDLGAVAGCWLNAEEAEMNVSGRHLPRRCTWSTGALLPVRGRSWLPGLGQQVLAEQEGQPPCGGRPFTKTGLHRLLTNVTYVGRVRYKGEGPPRRAGRPLVDAGAFQRVGQVLAHNGPTPRPRRPPQPAGGVAQRVVALVARAAAAMTPGALGQAGAAALPLLPPASGRRSGAGMITCPSKSIPAAEIEALVVEQVKEVGRDPALLHSVLEQRGSRGRRRRRNWRRRDAAPGT